MEPCSHFISAREALTGVIAARIIPAASRIRQQNPSASGAVPIASSVERGSSSRKDGNVNASVTTDDSAKGSMRKTNNKSAEARAERGRNTRCMSFHPQETVRDSDTYSTTNTARETPMQRAVNIKPSPCFQVRDASHPAIAANRSADQHHVGCLLPPGTKVEAPLPRGSRAVAGWFHRRRLSRVLLACSAASNETLYPRLPGSVIVSW